MMEYWMYGHGPGYWPWFHWLWFIVMIAVVIFPVGRIAVLASHRCGRSWCSSRWSI